MSQIALISFFTLQTAAMCNSPLVGSKFSNEGRMVQDACQNVLSWHLARPLARDSSTAAASLRRPGGQDVPVTSRGTGWLC